MINNYKDFTKAYNFPIVNCRFIYQRFMHRKYSLINQLFENAYADPTHVYIVIKHDFKH